MLPPYGRPEAPPASWREVRAKSLLRKGSRVDSWFLAGCGLNLYRGCAHDCAYCDGRAEKYAVEGEFGREVAVKVNAPELLRRELAPPRGRAASAGRAPAGYVLLGGGVGDSYQPAEERYRLARSALELLLELGRPVHVLTKSILVERAVEAGVGFIVFGGLTLRPGRQQEHFLSVRFAASGRTWRSAAGGCMRAS